MDKSIVSPNEPKKGSGISLILINVQTGEVVIREVVEILPGDFIVTEIGCGGSEAYSES